jgi:sigma-B regulation protein RsbU (phosphoserine phosphatase)
MHSLLSAEQFTTAFYGILHTGLDTLFYVAAGSPPPLILRADGSIEWIDSTGMPLGITENNDYRIQEISFASGDLLLLYSDSLIEQKLPSGEILNETRLAEIVAQTASKRSNHLPNAILQTLLENFRNDDGEVIPLADDLTINIYLRQ